MCSPSDARALTRIFSQFLQSHNYDPPSFPPIAMISFTVIVTSAALCFRFCQLRTCPATAHTVVKLPFTTITTAQPTTTTIHATLTSLAPIITALATSPVLSHYPSSAVTMSGLIDPELVIDEFDKAFDSLYCQQITKDATINRVPVCIVCDRFVRRKERVQVTSSNLQKWNSRLRMPESLSDTLNDDQLQSIASEYSVEGFNNMLLSPRSPRIIPRGVRIRPGETAYVSCRSCKLTMQQNKLPVEAIANGYAIGSTPDCIAKLTDFELSYLCPVKTFGYCFTYIGGKQKQLSGYLSYYKVSPASIATSAAHLSALHLNDNVVVVLSGKMTTKQRDRAIEKSTLRVRLVMDAIKWLKRHHQSWRYANYDAIEAALKKAEPKILRNIELEEDSQSHVQSNIETSETFTVFYPDGTMNSLNGGQKSHAEFRKMVTDMQTSKGEAFIINNYNRSFCRDYEDDNFVNAHVAQFPYGIGGFNEARLGKDGDIRKPRIVDYVHHLSRLSPLQFHRPLFVLSLFNLYQKQRLVETASLKYRGKQDLSAIVNGLTTRDLRVASSARRHGTRFGTYASNHLLDGVDACSRALPHSVAASLKARGMMESLQHEFGQPGWFVTITPDDENSYLVQVYCMDDIDNDTPIEDLSDDDLHRRATRRKELRIKYPGICALVFEDIIEIVFEKVIGWDMNTKQRVDCEAGYILGVPIAATLTVEEQGRKTLHAHILVWTTVMQCIANSLRNGNPREKDAAKRKLCSMVDNVSTNSLASDRDTKRRAWSHGCTDDGSHATIPRPASNQQLRNLRHAKSWRETQGIVAECPRCFKTWTNEELIEDYLIKGMQIPGLSSFPDTYARRLESMYIQYQKRGGQRPPTEVANAAWSNHRSAHVSSCFPAKKQKQSSSAKNCDWECRHRKPHLPCYCTVVEESEPFPTWSLWHGGNAPDACNQTFEIIPRRGEHDLFQNNALRPVSHSKNGSNTNVSGVVPGPVGPYATKYCGKPNQQEDNMEYRQTLKRMEKTLVAERVHEDDAKEGLRWIIVAAYAHNDANVIGAPLASFLIKNHTRFIFSHDFAWIPLQDLDQLLLGSRVFFNAHAEGQNRIFFENYALHYLCRNPDLDHLSPYDFYADYEIITRNQSKRDTFKFINTPAFQHPSVIGNRNRQTARKRVRRAIPRVLQKIFPDTASLGDLLDNDASVTIAMESYARTILLLFHNYRSASDLLLEGSCTTLLRRLYGIGKLHPKAPSFLQNVQDARYNFLRRRNKEDALQRDTLIYVPPKYAKDLLGPMEDRQEDNADNPDNMDEIQAQLFLQMLDAEATSTNISDPSPDPTISGFNFKTLRDSGHHQSGHKDIADAPPSCPEDVNSFLSTQASPSPNPNTATSTDTTNQTPEPITKQKIRVALTMRARRIQYIDSMKKDVTLLDASGSAASIIQWGRAFRGDRDQRRAFEAITASFVLACIREAAAMERNHDTRHRATFPQIMKLRKLAFGLDQRKWARHKNDQLLLFLHGPGGSGKSTVLDMVMMYCKEYYENLGQTFSSRTVIVSAMSGVAATLIMGETTHSSAHLNKRTYFEPPDIVPYEDTKLVIVDEISFAQERQIDKMYSNFKALKQELHQHYGGVNIVFAGDFRQLQPVNGSFIYDSGCTTFGPVINMFIELNGMHRFRDDMEWGRLLRRFRNGNPTRADITFLNDNCVYDSNVLTLPRDIQYATGTNRDRAAINVASFEKRCLRVAFTRNGRLEVDDGILVLADGVRLGENGQPLTPAVTNTFWQQCGEDSVFMDSGRMDPVLRLYHNCPLMMTHNENVPCGEANGTRALATQLVLKPGETSQWVPMQVDGTLLWIRAVRASQVRHLTLQHCNTKVQPPIFHMQPKKFCFKARLPQPKVLGMDTGKDVVRLSATQIPLVSNTATTGHKLQGATVNQLFVHEWAYRFKNWAYVVLSRVTTRRGIFFRMPLSTDMRKYALPPNYTPFINSFHDRLPTHYTDDMSPDEINEHFDSPAAPYAGTQT